MRGTAGVLVVLALAAPAKARSPGPLDLALPDPGVATAQLVAALHELHVWAADVGRLARTRGGTSNVRDLGDRLARDHAFVDRRLVALAGEHRVPLVDAAATSEEERRRVETQARALVELRGIEGPGFDAAFLVHAIDRLDDGLDAVRELRPRAVDREVRALADLAIPILEQQRRVAARLLGRLRPSARPVR